MSHKPAPWKLIGVSHPIADTGDYSGHYEITDGNITIITQDDDAESIQPIVDALNDSGCSFYFENSNEYVLSHENDVLRDQRAELLEALMDIVRASDHLQEPSFEAKIARQAIAKAEGK
jgi:hypothetical protein